MAVKASPETIREMKKDISNTIRDIERISSGIKSGMSATSNWDDAQAAQFNMLMQQKMCIRDRRYSERTLTGAFPAGILS